MYATINLMIPFGFNIPFSRSWHLKRIRTIMRGYRIIRNTSRLGLISEVKNLLTESEIILSKKYFHSKIFGEAKESAELSVRQYLLRQLGGLNLNRVLLISLANPKKDLAYPMPRIWRKIIKLNGFSVSDWQCKFFWAGYVFAMWLSGIMKIVQIITTGIKIRRCRSISKEKYIYFDNLSPNNLPWEGNNCSNHDIISWFCNWKDRDLSIHTIKHSVNTVPRIKSADIDIYYQEGPLPPLDGFNELTAYLRWSLLAIFYTFFEILRGHWWYGIILSDAALAAQARYLPSETLAKFYMFHNSNWIYRPLWTYEVEKKGSSTVMYFYSTNCEPFKQAKGYPKMYFGYRSMNWPNYFVWDDYQANFIRRANNQIAKIDIVGPIWFQGKCEHISLRKDFSVAVFDITPHRSSRYAILGLDTEYYLPSTVTDFLNEIIKILEKYNIYMLWKTKRKIGSIAHPLYRQLSRRLANHPNVVTIDADISAITVIEACNAVISLPFTSTALLGRSIGKPSVYFDPTGKLIPDDRAAHGINILPCTSMLENWLQIQLESFKHSNHHQ